MRLCFDRRHAVASVILFAMLVWLATAGAHLGVWRGFGGDVLAVIWLYCLFRSVFDAPAYWQAVAALACGCLLEFAQYVIASLHWQISPRALRIVLGSTPDWLDVLAYGIGFVLILLTRRAVTACKTTQRPRLQAARFPSLCFISVAKERHSAAAMGSLDRRDADG